MWDLKKEEQQMGIKPSNVPPADLTGFNIQPIALVPAADDYIWFHITANSSQHSRERSTDHRWFYHELDIHRRGVQCDVFFGL